MTEGRDYIKLALRDKHVHDAAIVGLFDNTAVWASKPGGILAAITPTEVEVLVGKDRGTLLTRGVSVGGMKTTVVRDCMKGQKTDIPFVDLRTKGSDQQGSSLAVAQTNKVLVFLMGKQGVHGGIVGKKAYDTAKYLQEKGF